MPLPTAEVPPEPMTDHDAVSAFFGGAFPAFPDIHFDAIGTDVWTVDADGRATEVHADDDSLTLLHAIGLA